MCPQCTVYFDPYSEKHAGYFLVLFSREAGQAVVTGLFFHDGSEVSHACVQAFREAS